MLFRSVLVVFACFAVVASGQDAMGSAAEDDSGYDGKRFTLRHHNGKDTLSVGGRVEFRYTLSARDGDSEDPSVFGDDDFTTGFDLPRTRVGFRGTTAGGLLDYNIEGSFSRRGGDFNINYAYAQADITDDIAVRFGRQKGPFMREELVSSSKQLAVDRSVMHDVFSTRFTEGVEFRSTQERWRWNASFNDGARAAGTPAFSAREADFGLTGRAEIRLGEAGWGQFSDLTSWRGNDSGWLLGAAAHYEQRGETAAFGLPGSPDQVDVADLERLFWTVDASYESHGWNLFAAIAGRHTDLDGGSADDEFFDWGAIVQGGAFVTERVELFGRWDVVFPDEDREDFAPSGSDADDFHTLTAGFNFYVIPESHAIKLTGDVQYFLQDTNNLRGLLATPDSSVGLMPDDDNGQVVVRLGVQILF